MTTIREAALREGIAQELEAWARRIDAGLEPRRRRPGNAALVSLARLAADSHVLASERLGVVEGHLADVAWARTHPGSDVVGEWVKLVRALRAAAVRLRSGLTHERGGSE